MISMLILNLLLLAGLIGMCAFFAGSETAVTGLSLQNIRNLGERKPGLVRGLKFWQKHPSQILTFLLIGNNGASVAAGVVATTLALQVHGIFGLDRQVMLIVVPAIVVILILFVGEVLPKVYGKQRPEWFTGRVMGLLFFGTRIFSPVIRMLVLMSDAGIRLFGGQKVFAPPFISSSELRHILGAEQESADRNGMPEIPQVRIDVPEDTRRMLENLVGFSRTRVEEIMVPRTKMFALDIKFGRDRIMRDVLEQRYSRVPVYDGSLDNIVGVVYSKDLIASMKNRELIILQDLLRPAYYTPELARVSDVMREFKTGRNHMAIVVDQYGGTAGLVTIEDILEEIVGEIYDEFDEQESTMTKHEDGSFLIWASEDVDRINEEFGLHLPEDRYETLAALALDIFGKIPRVGESRNYGPYILTVVEADRRRIYKIRLSRSKR